MHALYLEVRDTEMGISMEDRARKRDRAHQRREREQHEAEVAAALEQQRQQEEWRQQNQEAEVAAALEQQRQQEEWQQRNQEAEVAAAFEHQQQREAEVVAAFEHQRQQEEWQQQALQQQQQQQEQEYLQQRQLVLVPDARTSHRHLSPNAKLAKKLAEKKDDLVLDAKANTSSKRTDKIMQKRLEQQGPDLNATFMCAYAVDLWCEGKKFFLLLQKGMQDTLFVLALKFHSQVVVRSMKNTQCHAHLGWRSFTSFFQSITQLLRQQRILQVGLGLQLNRPQNALDWGLKTLLPRVEDHSIHLMIILALHRLTQSQH